MWDKLVHHVNYSVILECSRPTFVSLVDQFESNLSKTKATRSILVFVTRHLCITSSRSIMQTLGVNDTYLTSVA